MLSIPKQRWLTRQTNNFQRNFNVLMVFALLLGGTVGLVPRTAFAVSGGVVINEFVSDASQEWVELYNTSIASVDIGGWTINDNGGRGVIHTFASGNTIDDNDFVAVNVSGLNNTGDSVILKDDSNNEIDNVEYGGSSSIPAPNDDESVGRITDGSNAWQTFTTPTKDATNEADVAGDVFSTVNGTSAQGATLTQGQSLDVTAGVSSLSNPSGKSLRLAIDGHGPGGVGPAGEEVCVALFGAADCITIAASLNNTTSSAAGTYTPIDMTVSIAPNAPAGDWSLTYYLVTDKTPAVPPFKTHAQQTFNFTVMQQDNEAPHNTPTNPTVYFGHDKNGDPLTCEGDTPIYTKTNDILVDWSHPNPEDVAYYRFGIYNKNNYKEEHRNSRDNPGEFNVDGGTSYKVDITSPSNNPHRYLISAVGNNGEVSDILQTCPITLDTASPGEAETKIDTPADQQVLADGSFEITGTAFDALSGIDPDRVFITVSKLDQASGKYANTSFVNEQATYGTLNSIHKFSYDGISGLEDGSYQILLKAYDKAGNVRYDTVEVQIDSTTPTGSGQPDTGETEGSDSDTPGNTPQPLPLSNATQVSNPILPSDSDGEVAGEQSDDSKKEDAISLATNDDNKASKADVESASSNLLSNWWWVLAGLGILLIGFFAYRRSQSEEPSER